jgi:hypothetical protein
MARGRRWLVRLLGVLILAIVMYVAVPRLWQHAIASKVESVQANQSFLPPEPDIDKQVDSADPSNIALNINPPVVIDTKKYEAIAVQSQADEAMRRSQAIQDQAWQATH